MTVQPLTLSDLTTAERDWLAQLGTGKWVRVTGGYACRGRARILSVAMFDRLAARRLVYQGHTGPHPHAELTSFGKMMREADLQRRANRATQKRRA